MLTSSLILNFSSKNDLFYNLLVEEDFDFKTKDININFENKKDFIEVNFEVKSILDFKIASNAIIKSLEIIEKTLLVGK